MRTEILDKHPSAKLQVFVAWFAMRPGDGRHLVDRRVLGDRRVTNFWDERRLTGRWFAQHVAHDPGATWDAYFLYGPGALWDAQHEPLTSWGGTVIGSQDESCGRSFAEACPAM